MMIKLTRYYNGAAASSVTLRTTGSIIDYLQTAPAGEQFLIESYMAGYWELPHTDGGWTYSIERIK